jgi:hypothetical protein
VHGRRLARAVGPEEAVDTARLDLEADAVDCSPPTELAHEVLDLDAVVRYARRCSRDAGHRLAGARF